MLSWKISDTEFKDFPPKKFVRDSLFLLSISKEEIKKFLFFFDKKKQIVEKAKFPHPMSPILLVSLIFMNDFFMLIKL